MDLMELLPGFYRASPEMTALQAGFAGPVEDLWQAYDSLMAQLDIQTATWGLRLWEEQYGLDTDVTRPLEERRARLLSKVRGQGTTTAALIQNVAESFVGGTVEVLESPASYWFELAVREAGERQSDLRGLAQAVEEIRPAHLGFHIRDLPQPIRLPEALALRFRQLGVCTPFRNARQEVVLLDGKRQLDGDWLLYYVLQGMAFPIFQTSGLSWYTTPDWKSERLTVGLAVPMDFSVRFPQWRAVLPLREAERAAFPAFGAILLFRTQGTVRHRLALIAGWTEQPERLGLQAAACISLPVPFAAELDTVRLSGLKTTWTQRLNAHITIDSLYHLDGVCRLDGRRKLNASIREEQI